MKKENVTNKYKDVQGILDTTLDNFKEIELIGEEENSELDAIYGTLKKLSESFKKEIDKLEESSEWEKYCIAFFGETNAGKSTIIESLRIIYDEETRRCELDKKEREYCVELVRHINDYKELVESLNEVNKVIKKKRISKIVSCIIAAILGAIIGCIVTYLGIC